MTDRVRRRLRLPALPHPHRRSRTMLAALIGAAVLPVATPTFAATGVVGGGGVGGGTDPGQTTPALTPAPLTDAPEPAPTGTFHLWGCRTPDGTPAPTDGWVRTLDLHAGTTYVRPQTSGCEDGGSLLLAAGIGTNIANDQLLFGVGRGLRLLDGTIWRSARAVLDNPPNALVHASALTVNSAHPIPADQQSTSTLGLGAIADWLDAWGSLGGTPVPSGTMTRGTDGAPLDADNRVWLGRFDASAESAAGYPLIVYAQCNVLTDPSGCEVRYRLWASDLRIVDAFAPSVTTFGGDLATALQRPSGDVAGVAAATVGASDTLADGAIGSGVRRATVEVDGRTVATGTPELTPAEVARCTPQRAADGLPAYTARRPCPASAPMAIRWDTRGVADGRHAVRVLVEDAAGNTTVAGSGEVVVRNGTSVGPGSPLELRGSANGSPASDAASLKVLWPATARRASTAARIVQRCKGAGYARKHPVQCAGKPAASATEAGWSTSKRLRGELTLLTPSGQPIAGAAIELVDTPATSAPQQRTLGRVTTDAAGRATFEVAAAEGSRTIEARWLARTLDTRPAAIGTATLTVRAITSIRAPRRVAPGAKVTFRGQLGGRAGSSTKVPIRLEVRDGGRWKTFATASTNASGAWSTTLRFATTPGSYAVRAKVGTTTTYPYAAGESAGTVTVSVR